MNMEDLTPPHDGDAEAALLSLILADNTLLDDPACAVAVDDFYVPSHATIYRTARKCRASGQAFDAVVALDALADLPDAMERIKSIMSMGFDRALRHHAPGYAASVCEKSQRRKLLVAAGELGTMVRDPSVNIDEVIARFEATSRSGGHGSSRFEWHTAADLDAGDFELNYLIDGILVAGQPAILAGPQKSLKTNISVDLVLSLASGHPFLGKFFINGRMNAGLMTGESGEATVQETARRVAWSKGWALSSIKGAFFSFDLPNLSNPSCMEEIRRFIADHDLKCLVVDPAYLAMGDVAESASNLFSMGDRLKPLGTLAKQTGCTIALCHHTRKNRENHFAPPKLEDLAFAGFQEYARQWVMLGRREAYDPEQAGSHKLWLEVGGSVGHAGRWGLDIEEGSRADPDGRIWDVDVRSGHEVLRERADAAEDEKLAQKEATAERREKAAIKMKVPKAIEFLKTPQVLKHDGASESAIRIGAGCSMNVWPTVFDHLKETGVIEPCQYVGGNNRLYPGFKLSATEQQNRSKTEAEQFGCNHTHAHEQNTPL